MLQSQTLWNFAGRAKKTWQDQRRRPARAYRAIIVEELLVGHHPDQHADTGDNFGQHVAKFVELLTWT